MPAAILPDWLLAHQPSTTVTERTAGVGSLPPAGPLLSSSRGDDGLLHCLCGEIRHCDSWGQIALAGFF